MYTEDGPSHYELVHFPSLFHVRSHSSSSSDADVVPPRALPSSLHLPCPVITTVPLHCHNNNAVQLLPLITVSIFQSLDLPCTPQTAHTLDQQSTTTVKPYCPLRGYHMALIAPVSLQQRLLDHWVPWNNRRLFYPATVPPPICYLL